MDEDQTYWEQAAADYEEKTDTGPEVLSHLACAANRFWTRSLNEEKLTALMDKAKTPANCRFMAIKQTNKPVFTTSSPSARTLDISIQKIQGTHAATSSLIMQAVTELQKLQSSATDGSRVRTVADRLKEALMLAGYNNQQLNALRRDIFKPTIPSHLKKICDSPPEEAENLFGDNIQDKLTEIKADNALREEFFYKPSSSAARGKTAVRNNRGDNRTRPYDREEGSNCKASQKSRGGQETGQHPKHRDHYVNSSSDTRNNNSRHNSNPQPKNNRNNKNSNNNSSNNNNSNPKKTQKKK